MIYKGVLPMLHTYERNVEVLGDLPRNQLFHFCIHVAKSVLHVWENRFPDNRPRRAIEVASTKNPSITLARTVWNLGCDAERSCMSAASAAFVAANTIFMVKANPVHNAAQIVLDSTLAEKDKLHWLNDLYHAILGKPHFPNHWKTRDTVSIAKDMLTSRNLKDMPILADALEDSGCTDAEVLSHLRCNHDLWCPGDWVLTNLGA